MKTLIEIAITQIGVKEVTKNSGPEVDQYLKSVGLSGGYPWCAAFVSWCINEAKKTGLKTTFKNSAGVLEMWNLNKAKHAVIRPMTNDVFIMEFKGGRGHTGIVKDVIGNKIVTIEGNTNVIGSREGEYVMERTRGILTIKGFLRV